MIILKNRLNNRQFRLAEQATERFKQNIKLQQRLDEVGSYYRHPRSSSTSIDRTNLFIVHKKLQANKIEQENVKIAKRIVGSKPVYNIKKLEHDFVLKNKLKKQMETKDSLINEIQRNLESSTLVGLPLPSVDSPFVNQQKMTTQLEFQTNTNRQPSKGFEKKNSVQPDLRKLVMQSDMKAIK